MAHTVKERDEWRRKGGVREWSLWYIASWLVKLLLEQGYYVRATVRNPNDTKKTGHLLALDGAKERLHLFKADLLEEGSFDSVVDGCDGVFHTASQLHWKSLTPRSSFLSGNKAMVHAFKDLSRGGFLEVCKREWMDMVVMNPGWVIGPVLHPILNLSVEEVPKLINGGQTFLNIPYRWVDVRDVANAHIQAYEKQEASGRYCLVGSVLHGSQTLKILHNLYPVLHISRKCEDDKPCAPTYRVSQEKAKSLGIHFTPLEVTLKDTVDSLKENNLISF
ncbi:Cinnamoyl-CoA reductase 1 [Vitis vinifera]|uniref:Cinnamoyl-CoA reductase 1 n=1 Tax=Vitis vinifera TaxID=29760 RepID=A0A438GWM4_VITVI|nr:Cinnamoyl-CoA reductase 1 [Vitis vinifera]